MEQDRYTYYAFISYKREDEKWAKWLQSKLESYGFPVALRKENASLPAKIRPIFRDQSELSGGNLKKEIEKGLSGSKYLIVVCSPRAAKSPWVSKEVQYFIDNGREEFIVPFIIGCAPNATNPEEECFPEGLRLLSGEKEILGININEMGRDAAAIKVIARMFGLRFDTLWQRHERAKRRRRLAVVAGVVIFALTSFGVGAYMAYLNTQISAQRDRAEAQTKIANNELDISAEFTAWLNGDKETYNPFASDVIPAFNPISYFSDKPDRNWGNYTINHFDSLDEDGLYKLFVTHNNKSMGYIAFDPKYKLNRDFNYSRTLPVIAYRKNDYSIKVLDLTNKQSYKIFQSWKSEDSLINKIAVFNTGSEIAINGKLFSRRAFSPLQAAILHVYRDSTSMSHEYKFNKNIDKKRIRYNGQSWSLLDSKYNRNLYIEDGNGSGFEKLLIENDGQFQSFAPFIGFTMGNGIGMMFSARIISKDEILIIASQGQHFVYNTKTGNRLYFSSSNLNTFDSGYCHAQMFTSGADLVNQDRWLVTVSGGGVITIHDIRTGCLLMECTIQPPGEYAASNFTSSIYFTPSHFSEDGKYIYGQLSVDDDKKYIGYQIPTLTDFIKQARKEFAKFWND